MKNLTCILTIAALLMFGIGCASFTNILPMSNDLRPSAFAGGSSFDDADDIVIKDYDRGKKAQDESGEMTVDRTRDYTAATLCGKPGAPTHICGKSDSYY